MHGVDIMAIKTKQKTVEKKPVIQKSPTLDEKRKEAIRVIDESIKKIKPRQQNERENDSFDAWSNMMETLTVLKSEIKDGKRSPDGQKVSLEKDKVIILFNEKFKFDKLDSTFLNFPKGSKAVFDLNERTFEQFIF